MCKCAFVLFAHRIERLMFQCSFGHSFFRPTPSCYLHNHRICNKCALHTLSITFHRLLQRVEIYISKCFFTFVWSLTFTNSIHSFANDCVLFYFLLHPTANIVYFWGDTKYCSLVTKLCLKKDFEFWYVFGIVFWCNVNFLETTF